MTKACPCFDTVYCSYWGCSRAAAAARARSATLKRALRSAAETDLNQFVAGITEAAAARGISLTRYPPEALS